MPRSTDQATTSTRRHSPVFKDVLPKGRACLACRRRKVRCSGQLPSCKACVTFARYTGAPMEGELAVSGCSYVSPSRPQGGGNAAAGRMRSPESGAALPPTPLASAVDNTIAGDSAAFAAPATEIIRSENALIVPWVESTQDRAHLNIPLYQLPPPIFEPAQMMLTSPVAVAVESSAPAMILSSTPSPGMQYLHAVDTGPYWDVWGGTDPDTPWRTDLHGLNSWLLDPAWPWSQPLSMVGAQGNRGTQ